MSRGEHPLRGDQRAGAKCSPSFSVRVPPLADAMRANGLVASRLLMNDPDRHGVPHALLGHHVVAAWLTKELNFTTRQATQWAGVVGNHHGTLRFPPESGHRFSRAQPRWQDVRYVFPEASVVHGRVQGRGGASRDRHRPHDRRGCP
ncbi:HD domain-containing protein [Amycolatopsis sp. H20-H5]|uniref:HD domain-containing protein n=1 Tax=Amycolatopsis sp. H20-H5 TaxID=3046309 RepID=UPI003FA36C3E